MKTGKWAVLAVLGLGLMVLSFYTLFGGDAQAPWGVGLMCIGEEESAKPLEVGTVVSARLRLLPARAFAEALIRAATAATHLDKANLQARVRPKLVELPVDEMLPLAGWLREGRMPEPGRHEVLAGSQTPPGDELNIAGATLRVVGVLKPGVALLADCYVAPAHASMGAFFSERDGDVHRVKLVRLSAEAMRDQNQLMRVIEAFPPNVFTLLGPEVRLERVAFQAYLASQALFLLGGTGLLISMYRWLAAKVTVPLLAAPLHELDRRPRLLWSVHLAYFGLFLGGSIFIYEYHDIQIVIMKAVQGELSSAGSGVLAVAGRAYGSGNMVYAAAVTFMVNFFVGSLAQITLPSMVIPGCGALLAMFRATLWGVLLGPSEVALARSMLPHTGTLLLEGAGYIVAAFYALLIPIFLFAPGQSVRKPSTGDEGSWPDEAHLPPEQGAWRRFRRALLLNLKGSLLVAGVLAVAACYEAVEVILMKGF